MSIEINPTDSADQMHDDLAFESVKLVGSEKSRFICDLIDSVIVENKLQMAQMRTQPE